VKNFSFRAALVAALFASLSFAQVATPPGPATGSPMTQLLQSIASMPAIGAVCPSYNINYLNYQTGEERFCVNGTVQAGTFAGAAVGTAIASATTIAPVAPITHITGTTAVVNITAPTNFAQSGYGGCLVLIPDAAFTTTAAGNVAIASTAVLSKQLSMCYDNATAKWYPSY
jgi:hypothetical protein